MTQFKHELWKDEIAYLVGRSFKIDPKHCADNLQTYVHPDRKLARSVAVFFNSMSWINAEGRRYRLADGSSHINLNKPESVLGDFIQISTSPRGISVTLYQSAFIRLKEAR